MNLCKFFFPLLLLVMLSSCGGGGGASESDSAVDPDNGELLNSDGPVEVSPETLTIIQETADLINSDTELLSNDEYRKSELAKRLEPEEKRNRRTQIFDLAGRTADPDPEWLATSVSQDVVISYAGTSHVIEARKLDVDGNDLGLVDSTIMKFVVVIQRDVDTFETIDNASSYVKWLPKKGSFEIKVPNDLTQGRVMVGLRPNLSDKGEQVIAERWSQAVTIEVWPLQANIRSIDSTNVVFPKAGDELEISAETNFSKAEIIEELSAQLNEGLIVLPLIVKNTDLEEGELVDYIFNGSPYSGRVVRSISRNNQQLVLMAPDWYDVYSILDAEDGFLVKAGILPEFVMYPNSLRKPKSVNASVDTKAAGVTGDLGLGEKLNWKFFDGGCDADIYQLNFIVEASLKDVGVFFNYSATGDNVTCAWKASKLSKLNKAANLIMKSAGGPATLLIQKLFGSEVKISPVGEISFSLKADSASVFGLQVGGSLENGWVAEPNLAPLVDLADGDIGLTDASMSWEGKGGLMAGIKLEFIFLQGKGVLGDLVDFLGWQVPQLAIESEGVIRGALGLLAASPSHVYLNKENSKVSVQLSSEISIRALDVLITALNRLLEDKINPSFTEKITILNLSLFELEFLAKDIEDDGQGKATIGSIQHKSEFIETFFSDSNQWAKMAPEDRGSSVFEDVTNNISYSLQECERNEDTKITAPAIACQGIFCGKSNDVTLCGKPKYIWCEENWPTSVCEGKKNIWDTSPGGWTVSIHPLGSCRSLVPSPYQYYLVLPDDDSEQFFDTVDHNRIVEAHPSYWQGLGIQEFSSCLSIWNAGDS